MLTVLLALPTAILLASSPRGSMEATSAPTRYEIAKESVAKAVRHFPEVETVGAKDVLQLREEGKQVLLVDVRTEDEMQVSMLRGAVSQKEFESSSFGEPAKTGEKFQESAAGKSEAAWDVVVPYCTVGYRSGKYAQKLVDLGYPTVKNSEGVVMWTHDIGSGLVKPRAADVRPSAEGGGGSHDGVEVKRVHVYASPWDYASEDYEAVKFTPHGWLGSTIKSAFSKVFGGK